MKITKSIFPLITLIIALTLCLKVFSSTEVISVLVNEDEYVIIVEKEKLKAKPVILKPGKYEIDPNLHSVHRYSNKAYELDGNLEAMAKDKRVVLLDTKTHWQIVDPIKFFFAFRSEQRVIDNLNAAIRHKVMGFVNAHSICDLFEVKHQKREVVFREEVNNKFDANYLLKVQSSFAKHGVKINSIKLNGNLKGLVKQAFLSTNKCGED